MDKTSAAHAAEESAADAAEESMRASDRLLALLLFGVPSIACFGFAWAAWQIDGWVKWVLVVPGALMVVLGLFIAEMAFGIAFNWGDGLSSLAVSILAWAAWAGYDSELTMMVAIGSTVGLWPVAGARLVAVLERADREDNSPSGGHKADS